MAQEQQGYVAYLVRFWQISSGESIVWRASLDDPSTGERKGFANPASLFTFLCDQLGESSADDQPAAIQEKSNDV
jgi:hypothetical protein